MRAATCRIQALMVLRWFRDDTTVRMLAIDAHLPISTAYRYLYEGITVLAAQAPTCTPSAPEPKPKDGPTSPSTAP